METFGIALAFMVMVTAPCAIALRSTGRLGDMDPGNPEPEVLARPILVAGQDGKFSEERPLTLAELAARAENDAMIARELAREAQTAALEATAVATRLRADAAIEAAKAAEEASLAAQKGYLPGDHPSLDFPRSRVRRRAA